LPRNVIEYNIIFLIGAYCNTVLHAPPAPLGFKETYSVCLLHILSRKFFILLLLFWLMFKKVLF